MMCINGYLKLVDMGTAKKLKIERRYRTTTIIGTPHYMAP
jgi:cGMP-dependent protein kinase